MRITRDFLSWRELSYWMDFLDDETRWNPPNAGHSKTQTLKEFRSHQTTLDNEYKHLVHKVCDLVEAHYEEDFVVSNAPSFRRYTPGSFIGVHFDYSGDSKGRTLQLNRERHGLEHLPPHPIGLHDVQTVVYFNDNFTGGDFFLANGETISPVAGSVIMFPSTSAYGHGVTEVIEGNRYISAHFWIRAKTMALAVRANLLDEDWQKHFWWPEKVEHLLGL